MADYGSLLDRPINGDWFEAYLRHVLAPTLRPGDIIRRGVDPRINS